MRKVFLVDRLVDRLSQTSVFTSTDGYQREKVEVEGSIKYYVAVARDVHFAESKQVACSALNHLAP